MFRLNIFNLSSIKIGFIAPLFNYVEYPKVMFNWLLESLPFDLAFEIIDDGSSDATIDWLNIDYCYLINSKPEFIVRGVASVVNFMSVIGYWS